MSKSKATPLQVWRAQYAVLVAQIRAVRAVTRGKFPEFSVTKLVEGGHTQVNAERIVRRRRRSAHVSQNQSFEATLSKQARAHMEARGEAHKANVELRRARQAAWLAEQPEPVALAEPA